MNPRNYRLFNWLSIFFIFMLFVIGGLVRSTGSGMGCPDWPKCFGQYVPPLSENELPDDYEEYYKKQRVTKTKRFTQLLQLFGFSDKANQIQQATQLNESHKFNVVKAYVEYINRLWGALTGLIVFICTILSFYYLKKNLRIFIFTLLGFLAVFFNALLGAVVVNSNLIGGIVTAHFIAAFASISFFMIARRLSSKSITINYPGSWISISLMIVATIQVIVGAFVRESFDLNIGNMNLDQTVESLYPNLYYHGIIGVIIMSLSILQLIKVPRHEKVN
ncbi:MAG: COX15/CtaA family protein, partial [Bacteroidia bacterium]|nr:COX15/CtaA family protein [Bacteroidia bacterium]